MFHVKYLMISKVSNGAAVAEAAHAVQSLVCGQQEGLMFKRLVAATIVSVLASATAAQAQERDVKFTLDFISLGRHAPWYVALGKGYYKDEGLNVTILPSKGTADAIRAVATGTSEFGFIDIPSLVAAGSAASNVKIVAANYQKPPYCIFSLNPGANIDTPKKMLNIELGSSTASFVPKIWAAFMEMNGVDSKTMKVVNIDGAARVPMLATGKVPAIDLFIMSEPAIRRAVSDAKPVCLFAGDFGLEIYANSIGVNEDFLKKDPEVVKKFVRAALHGWKDTFANPEEAAKIQLQYVKALDPKIVVDEIDILRRVALSPDVAQHGFGYVSTARMQNTVDFINKNIDVAGERLTAEQIYVPSFLPEKPILP
jgi:NitT/TauT family transport system substrate-binding protein